MVKSICPNKNATDKCDRKLTIFGVWTVGGIKVIKIDQLAVFFTICKTMNRLLAVPDLALFCS